MQTKGSDKVAKEGHDNLIPLNERTKEEQRTITTMGGIASGKVRQEKATFKKAIKWLVDSDIKIKGGTLAETFQKAGIDISNLTPTQLATIGLWFGAVNGNATNYKMLMEANEEIESTNETPTIEIKVVDNSNLEKVMYEDSDKL